MKNLNNFWFGAILTLSILSVIWCFDYADNWRGYNSTGGEVFTIALPLYIVWKKLTTMGRQIEKLKRQNNTKRKHTQ